VTGKPASRYVCSVIECRTPLTENYRVLTGNLTFRDTTEYTLMRDHILALLLVVARVSSSGVLSPFISERIQARSLTNASILAAVKDFLM
jgi:hypothetical protein